MSDASLVPGTVITNRDRLWRVGAHEHSVRIATSMDRGEPEQLRFHVAFWHGVKVGG